MKVYEFIYCPCIYESGYSTVSIHLTKKGAYLAMRKWLDESYLEWYNERIIWGKRPKRIRISKFAEHEAWGIREGEVLD